MHIQQAKITMNHADGTVWRSDTDWNAREPFRPYLGAPGGFSGIFLAHRNHVRVAHLS